ncbi:MAG: DUF839 domain-containing protein [Leptolyngbyaceae cyanobacterium MO_188.B28]|nr:DUF839 domain-containing protein [Leptolyngbyaceae cyanobacterium MO_188.B28]
MAISRRQFLAVVGSSATGVILATHLKRLYDKASRVDVIGYGPLHPDPNGLLDLPTGFQYRVLSQANQSIGEGERLPGAHDGMGAFTAADGNTILIRNHELTPSNRLGIVADQPIGASSTIQAGKGGLQPWWFPPIAN